MYNQVLYLSYFCMALVSGDLPWPICEQFSPMNMLPDVPHRWFTSTYHIHWMFVNYKLKYCLNEMISKLLAMILITAVQCYLIYVQFSFMTMLPDVNCRWCPCFVSLLNYVDIMQDLLHWVNTINNIHWTNPRWSTLKPSWTQIWDQVLQQSALLW